ncbi:MAG: hypothetical protein J3K34DRAFT_295501 [Monoraphidium minutum]|nr:MAG: hypothetical protein J3K34DRAFT_295501 [Monoraphidium minutum]
MTWDKSNGFVMPPKHRRSSRSCAGIYSRCVLGPLGALSLLWLSTVVPNSRQSFVLIFADSKEAPGPSEAGPSERSSSAAPAAPAGAIGPLVDAEAKRQDVARMLRVYDGIEAGFASGGLDVGAVAEAGKLFGGVMPPSALPGAPLPQPFSLNYSAWAEPLPEGAVRLVVVPVFELDIAKTVQQVSDAVAALLPPGTQLFANAPGDYHCTLFHLSHLYDPRPDTGTAAGGAAAMRLEPRERPQVTPEAYQREWQHVQRLLAATPPPTLEIDRVVMAPTGTLLLTWTNLDGRVTSFRRAMAREFPGASDRQAVIIHTTVLRVMTPRQLPAAAAGAVRAECARWTRKLRGTRVTPSSFWYVNEVQFSTIRGERMRFPLAGGGGGKGGGGGRKEVSRRALALESGRRPLAAAEAEAAAAAAAAAA